MEGSKVWVLWKTAILDHDMLSHAVDQGSLTWFSCYIEPPRLLPVPDVECIFGLILPKVNLTVKGLPTIYYFDASNLPANRITALDKPNLQTCK
jgi:hypothetical protein